MRAQALPPPWRARALICAFAIGFGVLIVRSLYLQIIDNDFLQEQGTERFVRELEVPAYRGRILDRHGEPLAVSTPVKSIWAFPSRVEASDSQLSRLAELLEVSTRELRRKLDGSDDFVFLRRHLSPDAADRVLALKIKGVYAEREYRRFYPASEAMSHVVGFTNIDDNGQEGIELAQQGWLAGHPGSRRVIINRRGEVVEDIERTKAPQAGRDLVLAVDSKLQYLAYRELKAAVDAHRAKAGGLVILDVSTGEILALVNLPSHNPNNRGNFSRDKARNRALTDIFEPGSTLKPFTAAVALETGKFKPHSIIETAPGELAIGAATIHDAHRHGSLTLEEVIQKSSNVGAAKVALSLPAESMWRAFRDAGFGRVPQTGFPGEVAGLLRPHKTWRPIEQATMAYGHGIAVNLVQLARAYTIFASDGELKQATLLKVQGPVPSQRVFKTETVRAVRRMLEMAASPQGTAPHAQVVGYRVAGKTGTTHKLEGGGYADKKYVSSFIGFAPASTPRLIVAVMIDEPSAGRHYGGAVAAPIFSKVMGEALRYLNVPHDAPFNNVVLPPPSAPEIREEV